MTGLIIQILAWVDRINGSKWFHWSFIPLATMLQEESSLEENDNI